jgi:hypothetical protein
MAFYFVFTFGATLRLRQNNGPTAIADYQPSHSLSMAGSESFYAKPEPDAGSFRPLFLVLFDNIIQYI